MGFYSGFMVAKKIIVKSKKAGHEKSWQWISDGKGKFEIEEIDKKTHGTSVLIFLNENAKEYSDTLRVENIIKNILTIFHIPFL